MLKITCKYTEHLQYRLLLLLETINNVNYCSRLTVSNIVMYKKLQELPANYTVVHLNDKIINRNPFTVPGMQVETTYKHYLHCL